VLPTSAEAIVYVLAVAPEMLAHFAPEESQRRHWYAITGPVPDQPPALAVRSLPRVALPVMDGVVTLAGATGVPMNRTRSFCSSPT
jgi:hypothetical protein